MIALQFYRNAVTAHMLSQRRSPIIKAHVGRDQAFPSLHWHCCCSIVIPWVPHPETLSFFPGHISF
jgi:hypothetical protein